MIGVESLALVALLQAQGAQQRAYLELAQATILNPVTRKELSAAVLSPEGIASIRALFDQSIDGSLRVSGTPVSPELGGESILDAGRIVWVVYPDPGHPVVRQAVIVKDDPAELLTFLQSSADGRLLLESSGGLHALLYQMTNGPTRNEQRDLLDAVIGGMVAQHFKTWSTDPAIQARMIERTQWRGRYVGFWHIHPPRLKDASTVEALLRGAHEPEADWVVPFHEGHGHPILLRARLRAAILAAPPDADLRRVLAAAGPRRLVVPVSDPFIHANLDTPEGAAEWIRRWREAGSP